jgi:uncharacterized membrane protein YgcG
MTKARRWLGREARLANWVVLAIGAVMGLLLAGLVLVGWIDSRHATQDRSRIAAQSDRTARQTDRLERTLGVLGLTVRRLGLLESPGRASAAERARLVARTARALRRLGVRLPGARGVVESPGGNSPRSPTPPSPDGGGGGSGGNGNGGGQRGGQPNVQLPPVQVGPLPPIQVPPVCTPLLNVNCP